MHNTLYIFNLTAPLHVTVLSTPLPEERLQYRILMRLSVTCEIVTCGKSKIC